MSQGAHSPGARRAQSKLFLPILLLLLLLLLLVGCGSAAGSLTRARQETPLAGAGLSDAEQQFPGLPALPLGETDEEQLQRVALAANIKEAADYLDKSIEGASVQGSDLLLEGSADNAPWGLYRWGKFSTTDKPQSIKIDLGSGADYSRCFVLVSNYTLKRWDILGPLDAESDTFSYKGGISYLSEARNTYVIVVQSRESTSLLDKLTLTSLKDVQAPLAPTGLTTTSILPREISLAWDANSEPDLQGYNVYRGPQDGPGQPDQEQFLLNEDDIVLTPEYVDGGVAEQETYYYWVTALDDTGNESLPSEALPVTTPEDLPPAPPTNLAVSDVRGKRATLDWEASPDMDIAGYDIWIGPHDDFEQFQGTRWNSGGPVTELTFTVTGLQGDHDYWARVQAVDEGGHRSVLSDTVMWHTLPNLPPVADFTFPSYNSRGIPVTFNPMSTTDGSDDLEELEFRWDFNGDLIIDKTTQGPEQVLHQYDIRGPYSVMLTVDDGEFQDSVTKTVFISSSVRYYLGPAATGKEVHLHDADAKPDGRRLVLYSEEDADEHAAYFDGSGWQTMLLPEYQKKKICAALTPQGFAVVDRISSGWRIDTWDGSGWTFLAERTASLDGYPTQMDFASAPNGRLAIIGSGHRRLGPPNPDQYNAACWHQLPGGGFKSVKQLNTDMLTDIVAASDVACARANDRSWFLMLNRPDDTLLLIESTDDSNFETLLPANGPLQCARLTVDPADPSRVHWAYTTSINPGVIYYGDNWGDAPGGELSYDTGLAEVLGLSALFAGADNELRVSYSARTEAGLESLRHYDSLTATDSSMQEGYGVLGAAPGAALDTTGQAFVAADESCDAEIAGKELDGGSLTGSTMLYEPLEMAYLGSRSTPVCFDDGSAACVFQQHHPTAVLMNFDDFNHTPTYSFCGKDNWHDPESACAIDSGTSYLSASVSEGDTVLIYRFASRWQLSGTLVDEFIDSRHPRLLRHPESGQILLACASGDDGGNIEVRSWGGSSFDAPTVIYDGPTQIDRVCLASAPQGQWGIAWLDAGESLFLAERSSGLGWGAAQPLDTGTGVSWKTGVGLAYRDNGDMVVGVERKNADAGFWAGLRLGGSPIAWEKMADASGDQGIGIACFYHIGIPMVAYYWSDGGISAQFRVRVAEKHSGSWFEVEQFAELQGLPFGYAVDVDGNIVLTGFSLAYEPTRAITYVLSP